MPNPSPTNYSCRVCGNRENNISYTAREMMYGLKEEFNYFQCSQCNCLQVVTIPENMAKYYPSDYYSFGKYDGRKFRGLKGAIKKKLYRASVLGSTISKNLFGKKAFVIFQKLNLKADSRILDVGCGNGRNFLFPLAEAGFKNLMGCDPYLSETMEYDNGLVIRNTNVGSVEGKWDLITYHHAFEHLPNPLENLNTVANLLADEGICVIRIPTVSSFAWEKYRTDWVQFDAPRHFFLHSKDSMDILAKKAGLEVFEVQYDSTHFQFTGSEKYLNDIPLSAPKPKGFVAKLNRKLQQKKYGSMAKRLNREGKGDQAAFFLRKK